MKVHALLLAAVHVHLAAGKKSKSKGNGWKGKSSKGNGWKRKSKGKSKGNGWKGKKKTELDLTNGLVIAIDEHRDDYFCELFDCSPAFLNGEDYCVTISNLPYGPCDLDLFTDVRTGISWPPIFVVEPRVVTRDTSVIRTGIPALEMKTFDGVTDPSRSMSFLRTSSYTSPTEEGIYVEYTVTGMDVTYVYKKHRIIYELKDSATGKRYVMASSQKCDFECLATSLERDIAMPQGWELKSRILDRDLVINSIDGATTFVKDNLNHNYMLVDKEDTKQKDSGSGSDSGS